MLQRIVKTTAYEVRSEGRRCIMYLYSADLKTVDC